MIALTALISCLALHSALGQFAARKVAAEPASNSARQLLQQGQRLAAEGRVAEAEIPLSEAARLARTDVEVLTVLAQVKARIGKVAEAVELFRQVVQLAPARPETHLNLAIALADLGHLDEALQQVDLALKLSNRMPAAHVNRARILADLHREREAQDEFKVACSLASRDPDCFFYWSLLERSLGHFSKESELLQRVVTLRPDDYKAWFFLGRSLEDQAEDDKSVDALRHALALNPTSQEATYLLSRVLKKSDPEESRKLLEQLSEDRQRVADLEQVKKLGNQAYVADSRKEWTEAIRLLRQAVELCGDCEDGAALHKNLGLALCRTGHIEDARIELERSLKLNPNDPDTVKALSIISHSN